MKRICQLTAGFLMTAVTAGVLLGQPAPGGGALGGGAGGAGGFGGAGFGRGGRTEEATLRTALFDVVSRIGGPKAEGILVGQLEVTASAAEIVELDRLLEKMGGDRFKAQVLSAVHAVLKDPPEATEGGENRGSEALLYGLLVKYQDKTFLDAAHAALLDKDGRIQRGPMDYLTRILGKEALPGMQQLLTTAKLSDDARRDIRQFAQGFMGEHPVADAMVADRFRELSQELATPPVEGERRRTDPRGTAAGLLERLGGGRDVSAESLSGRKQLLATLRGQVSDTEILAMMDKVGARLNDMSDPQKAKTLSPFFTVRERQGGGGFGGFGGFGGGGGGGRPPGGGAQPPAPKGGN